MPKGRIGSLGFVCIAVAAGVLASDRRSAAQEPDGSSTWYWQGEQLDAFMSSAPNPGTGKVTLVINADEGLTVCGGSVGGRLAFTPEQLDSGSLSHHGPETDPIFDASSVQETIDLELVRAGDDWVGTLRVRHEADPDSCSDLPPLSYDSGTQDVRLALDRPPQRRMHKLTFRLVQKRSGKPARSARLESHPPGLECGDGVCTGRFRRGSNVVVFGVNDERWTFHSWRGHCRHAGTYLSCGLRIRGNYCSIARFMRGVKQRPRPRFFGRPTPGRC